jgi:hypothetical protein
MKQTDKSVLARLEVEESRAPHLQDYHLGSIPQIAEDDSSFAL